jgi:hypothetical protein
LDGRRAEMSLSEEGRVNRRRRLGGLMQKVGGALASPTDAQDKAVPRVDGSLLEREVRRAAGILGIDASEDDPPLKESERREDVEESARRGFYGSAETGGT